MVPWVSKQCRQDSSPLPTDYGIVLWGLFTYRTLEHKVSRWGLGDAANSSWPTLSPGKATNETRCPTPTCESLCHEAVYQVQQVWVHQDGCS